MLTNGCNLGKTYYCHRTEEICDPVGNCPVAGHKKGGGEMKVEIDIKQSFLFDDNWHFLGDYVGVTAEA